MEKLICDTFSKPFSLFSYNYTSFSESYYVCFNGLLFLFLFSYFILKN